jgi:hypothetical protein
VRRILTAPRAVVVLTTMLLLCTSGSAAADVVNVAARVGIAQTTRTFSVTSNDFNRDGREDIFLVRHRGDQPQNLPPSTLYRNVRGRRFANFLTEAFRRTDKHTCDWARVNRDRLPDMFCTVGLTQHSVNELWIQGANHSFSNRASEYGLTRETHGRYRYATFIHANRDRRPDIYVARYTGSCYCGLYDGDNHPNELWINQGSSFRKAPEFGLNRPVGAKKDSATCAQAVDYDRDRDQDLLLCGWKSLYLYRNNSGRGFTDVTGAKGLRGKVSDARLIDLNRDGIRDLVRLTRNSLTVSRGVRRNRWGKVVFRARVSAGEALAFGRWNRGRKIDIYVVGSRGDDQKDDRDALFLNRGRGRYKRIAIQATSGSGDDVASVDFNGDGRVEFVVTNGDRKKAGPVQLFMWRR